MSTARNVASGILGQFFSLLVAFFATPVLVRGLGASNYGLWNVALAAGAWVGFINMICSTCAVRFVGQALGRKDRRQVHEACTALRYWALIFGAVGCLALMASAPWLSERVLHLEPAQRSWAGKVLLFQAVFVLFQVLTAVESGIITASRRLDVVQSIRSIGLLLQSGGAAVVVLLGEGVVVVAGWVAAAQALEWLAAAFWARMLQPPAVLDAPVDVRAWAAPLFSFSAVLLAGYFAAQLFLPASRILLGSLRPVAEVAYFAVPLTLAINVKALSTHIASALFPVIAEKAGQGDLPGLKKLYLQGLRWSWLATVPTAALAIVLGAPFITAWVGPEFGQAVAPLMPALVIGVNAYYFSAMPELVAQGMGRPARWAALTVMAGLCNLFFGRWLIAARGPQGAAEALLISGGLLAFSLMIWIGRELKVSFTEYLRAFDWRIVAVTIAVSVPISRFVSAGAAGFAAVLCLGAAGLCLIALPLRWWLPKEEMAWLARRWGKGDEF